MSKIEIVVCDRCGEEIGQLGKKISVVNVRSQRGDDVKVRELCTTCGAKLTRFLAGATSEQEPERLDTALMDQLQEVRNVSSKALERYAEGASPEELVGALRDVSSGARRR